MTQVLHEGATMWPLPLGERVLVELLYHRASSVLEVKAKNTSKVILRGASPKLLAASETARRLYPHSAPGAVGETVVIESKNVRFVEDSEYDACNMERPDPETNGKGDLATVAMRHIVGIYNPALSETKIVVSIGAQEHALTPPPVELLGRRVFFALDFDTADKSKVIERESGLLVREYDQAQHSQIATVIGVGDGCEYLATGDRIIAPRYASSIKIDDELYFYVDEESDVPALLTPTSVEGA